MGDLIKEIAEWHEKTFAEESFEGQAGKFLDELVEFYEEGDQEKAITELADCFIVACGMWRFDKKGTLNAFITVETIMHNRGIPYEKTIEAINKKMEINKSRTWAKNGSGSYQHQ